MADKILLKKFRGLIPESTEEHNYSCISNETCVMLLVET